MSNMQIAGEYSTYFVPLLFEREVVQSLLPNWLELAPQSGLVADNYQPVIFMFGRQRDVRWQWGTFNSFGFNYEEFAVGIPYVQLAKTGQGPFYAMPQLYLNKLLPVILGYFWGFAKDTARIQTGQDTYEIRNRQNRLLISGEFKPSGQPGKPSDFPFFEEMEKRKMLQEWPLVDKTFWGSYVCVQFGRNSEQTVIQPVEAKIRIADAFLPGLPLGEYTVKGINEVPLGGLLMRTPWTMSMPGSCGAARGNGDHPVNKKKTLRALEQQAKARVDKVRDDPEGRYQLRLDFYQKYGFAEDGGPGFGHAELAFMRWAIGRGVLNPLDNPDRSGSPWWRAVNEEYLYLSELAGLMYEAGLAETGFSEPLRFWLAYLQSPSSITWYRAHNASIVHGYLKQIEVAKKENHPEQIFVNIVLYRVLYAQAMVEGNPIALGPTGHILADPHLDAVDIMVHLPHFYPNHYPLSQADIDDIVKGHCLEGIIVDVMDEFFIIRHLPELYHLAAGWLKTSQLEHFISGDKCVYPVLAASH